MVNCKINNVPVSVPKGTSILQAAAAIGVDIPTLCYLKDINEIGACCVCVVEIAGSDKLITSCNHNVEEGMEILTDSPKVQAMRKTNVELILSRHDDRCTTCVRSGNCSLQLLANQMNIIDTPYPKVITNKPWNKSFVLIRDYAKCIKCMRCIQICDKVQGIGIWDVSNTGSRTTVDVSLNRKIEESDCVACGQCITHCPTGALRERDDTDRVIRAINDPDTVTIVQVAPAVRSAWGEDIGLSRAEATEKRMAATLRRMGIDYVFDTNFAADLTIMEEGSEFVEKLTHKDAEKFPMFTSCCPGWVRFVKSNYPEFVEQLSTAKSPQQMFGAVAKSYFAKIKGIDPGRICSISIMPCLSKKTECAHENMSDAGFGQDVDIVLTTREFDRLIKSMHLHPEKFPEEEFDSPLGSYTGAAVIFGATGGVMEAALRSAHYLITGENPDPDAFKIVRGVDGTGVWPWKEAVFSINGAPVRTATVHGLAATRQLLEELKAGRVNYDFVEVMACPGGCVGGGGQPIKDGQELGTERAAALYALDEMAAIRFSHENPDVQTLYRDYFGSPLSHEAHKLLHTDHKAWKMPGEK